MKRCLLVFALVGCSARTGLHEPPPIETCPAPLLTDVGPFAVTSSRVVAQSGRDLVHTALDGSDRRVLVADIVERGGRLGQLEVDGNDAFFIDRAGLEKLPLGDGARTLLAPSGSCAWDCDFVLGPFAVSADRIALAYSGWGDSVDQLDREGRRRGETLSLTKRGTALSIVLAADRAFVTAGESLLRWHDFDSLENLGRDGLIAHDSKYLYVARRRGSNAVDVERVGFLDEEWEHFGTFEDESSEWFLLSFAVAKDRAFLELRSREKQNNLAIVMLEPQSAPRTLARCDTSESTYPTWTDRRYLRVSGGSVYFAADRHLRRVTFTDHASSPISRPPDE